MNKTNLKLITKSFNQTNTIDLKYGDWVEVLTPRKEYFKKNPFYTEPNIDKSDPENFANFKNFLDALDTTILTPDKTKEILQVIENDLFIKDNETKCKICSHIIAQALFTFDSKQKIAELLFNTPNDWLEINESDEEQDPEIVESPTNSPDKVKQLIKDEFVIVEEKSIFLSEEVLNDCKFKDCQEKCNQLLFMNSTGINESKSYFKLRNDTFISQKYFSNRYKGRDTPEQKSKRLKEFREMLFEYVIKPFYEAECS